ncbi:MAG: PD-(D/E)XK nuclease family protein, partial [Bacillus sp. (in: Bacteria)]|nr:PD-(D/E)XK nuclease family protein [Bacillus sp. (in: firmicutes)]
MVNLAKTHKRAVFDVMLESENEAIKTVAQFLTDIVGRSFVDPLEIFFNYLIGTTSLNGFKSPYLDFYIKEGEYATLSLYENIASLYGKLKKHFGDARLQLNHLVEMVDDYGQATMPLNVSSPYKDSDDAVQLMTAHKAKGLEFEYVFILSADHVAWGKGKGNNNLLSLPKNLIHIRHTGTTDGEKLRILYVALTRAKSTLYITNALKDFNEKSPDRLEYLEEYIDGDTVVSPLIPSGKVSLHYEAAAQDNVKDSIKNWLSPYVMPDPDMFAIYKERLSKYRMSASSLTSFIDIVYAGPQEFFKNYVLQAPREEETEAMIFGSLVHKTFEEVTNRHLSQEQAVEFFLHELEKKSLTVEMAQKIREKGLADLTISLNAFKSILEHGRAEVDFSVDQIVVNGVPITGKIDHMIVDEEKKEIEIYDFKTGGYHRERWQSYATLYKYMLQLGFYKLLLNNSQKYKKYNVRKAHILFVVPDRDGEVYDKVY